MDSPGNMPVSLGEVWFGETRWVGGGTVCGGGLPQNCYIDWPQQPWQPWVTPTVPAAAPYVAPQQYRFTPAPLSDADVDRIARRVAEILREAK